MWQFQIFVFSIKGLIVSRRDQIKKMLKENDDGLTIAEMSAMSGMMPANVWKMLEQDPAQVDWAYIDRWKLSQKTGKYAAVWCYCNELTEHCPPPIEIESEGRQTHKVCNCCGAEKPLDAYYKDKRQPGKHENKCKECRLAQGREWKKNNKEKAEENKRRYIQARRQRNLEARHQA